MENLRFDVIIIGGGAAGLFLASQLPKFVSAAILEINDRVGKKLLATGNGKCNLTNLDMSGSHYNRPDIAESFLSRFSEKDTVAALNEMGLVTKVIENRVYPYSECASTVLDVLRRAADERGTRIFTGHIAEQVENIRGEFIVRGKAICGDKKSDNFCYRAGAVVLASGSDATFGRDSTGLFAALGHTSRKMTPSLVPIRTNKDPLKGLQGVRVKAGVKLGDRAEMGEVLFKDFGLSGIAAFNISSEIARGRAKAGDVITLDLMPEYTVAEVENLLRDRAGGGRKVKDALTGTFHSRVQERVIWAAGCGADDIAADNVSALAYAIKNYKLTVEWVGDVGLAQVMSGGLDASEFDENMMSKKCKNAYAVGEAVDIDGDCGGFNLQWAFSSAKAVARAIAKSAPRARNEQK